jgi:Protein of unknown function (DUF2530)
MRRRTALGRGPYSVGMELRDEQPMTHEFGNRTYIVADVEPLDVDGVRTVQVGVALWAIGFLALVPFYGRLQDAGHSWLLWTCAAGCGLGLLGLEYCRRRKRARALRDQGEARVPRDPTNA